MRQAKKKPESLNRITIAVIVITEKAANIIAVMNMIALARTGDVVAGIKS